MSKGFVGITFLFFGFIAGLLTAATLIEYEIKRINKPIESAIILQLPKDEADLNEQLLYLSAEKGLLEEMQRQRIAKKK